jgi:hypothetical protein
MFLLPPPKRAAGQGLGVPVDRGKTVYTVRRNLPSAQLANFPPVDRFTVGVVRLARAAAEKLPDCWPSLRLSPHPCFRDAGRPRASWYLTVGSPPTLRLAPNSMVACV